MSESDVSRQSSGDEYAERMRAAATQLRARATTAYSTFLSSPDEKTGEQWDAGQLLAHVAEFGPYWLAQAQLVVDGESHPTPFGRVKSDAGRIAAIERDRAADPLALLDQTDAWISDVAGWFVARSDDELGRTGVHQTLGEMTVERIIEHFCVEHLEEHAVQLGA
ncbi:MAG: hypothetical protein QOJ92_407 [Frankiales bacterium]|nr:hypothetical protein [Frankiales bacterium]